MISTSCLLALIIFSSGRNGMYDKDEDCRKSVVKVHASQRLPDVDRPWTKQAAREAAGSGVVIEGNRILTSAHVVSYANTIFVEPQETGDKIAAKIVTLA